MERQPLASKKRGTRPSAHFGMETHELRLECARHLEKHGGRNDLFFVVVAFFFKGGEALSGARRKRNE